MSEDSSVHHSKNEIIIVRRRNNGDDGHHGGAWKIAYADFMTAMMAFFLVMWLVNSASEETKAAVASYFNPIKLTDQRPAERGLKQVGNTARGVQSAPKSAVDGTDGSEGDAAAEGRDATASAGEKTEYSEADYFKDPYAVLAEIVKETGTKTNISDAGEGGAATSGAASGATGGEAYRDPFDPNFWSKQMRADEDIIAESEAALRKQSEAQTEAEEAEAKATEMAMAGEAGAEAASLDAAEPARKAAADLKAEIEKALDGAALGKLAEGLSVEPAEGGVLVSLTDQFDFEMFRIGSAVPEKPLVIAMEKIGEILATRQGPITIRGHTDARPFTDGTDDNWRLSMERAHSAYFMLVRGGVREDRIVQLSGFAERKLKDEDNPFAEVNRRIEILLGPAGE